MKVHASISMMMVAAVMGEGLHRSAPRHLSNCSSTPLPSCACRSLILPIGFTRKFARSEKIQISNGPSHVKAFRSTFIDRYLFAIRDLRSSVDRHPPHTPTVKVSIGT
jgi:hypothetical protein